MPQEIQYGPPGHGCTAFTQVVPETARKPGNPWLWVHCTDYMCGHSRAVALMPWAIRWGVSNPKPLIQKRFYCSMCQSKGANFTLPSHSIDKDGAAPFPVGDTVRVGGRGSTLAAGKRNAEVYGFLWRNRLQRYWNA